MMSFGMLRAGVRLDAWPEPAIPPTPPEAPEVAELKEELRKSLPQVAELFDVLATLRPVHELTGQLAGPRPARLVTQKG